MCHPGCQERRIREVFSLGMLATKAVMAKRSQLTAPRPSIISVASAMTPRIIIVAVPISLKRRPAAPQAMVPLTLT